METPTILIGLAVIALLAVLPALAIRKLRKPDEARRLDEYEFYPFITDEAGLVHFSPERFELAAGYFLGNRNPIAARELLRPVLARSPALLVSCGLSGDR